MLRFCEAKVAKEEFYGKKKKKKQNKETIKIWDVNIDNTPLKFN